MSGDDQAAMGGDWRVQLNDLRTVRELKAENPPDGAAQRLADRVLRAAAENPDHSPAGRAAAEAELRARGAAPAPWRVSVPGFIKPGDLEHRGDRLFFGWGRAVRVWSGRLVYFALLALIGVAGWMEFNTPATDRAVAEHVIEAVWAPRIGAVALAALAVWLLASALRRKPARVLLLSKFNTRALTKPLERMLAGELRPYGHVISLSDQHLRRDTFGWLQPALLSLSNPLAAIWFVIGLPIRFLFRLFDRSGMGPAVVLNAQDYRNLARRLRDRIGLNLQVALVSKEAFLVRTSDPWWRTVVRLMLESSDAIVVDLSKIGEGTAWELDVIREEHALERCVFVALWGKAEEAQAVLARAGVDAPCFYYAPDGEMQRRAQFRAAMLAAMRATHRVSA